MSGEVLWERNFDFLFYTAEINCPWIISALPTGDAATAGAVPLATRRARGRQSGRLAEAPVTGQRRRRLQPTALHIAVAHVRHQPGHRRRLAQASCARASD